MHQTALSCFHFLAAGLLCLGMLPACVADPGPDPADRDAAWPRRVLVTNDNGIDDIPLIEMARALAKVTEVHVVAATTDRSGTSNLMASVRSGEFQVERRDLGEGIEAWALDGYPADCVLFGVSGPLRDRLPDLVISGINGGPNLADEWFASGTIGAARAAAYFGIPSVAISGLDDDDPDAVRAATRWVVELIRSDAVRALRPPQYLTVSLPLTESPTVTGIETANRARGLFTGRAHPAAEGSLGQREIWRLDLELRPELAPQDSDFAAHGRGAIAVVPMRVDESDPEMLARLRERPDMLPAWTAIEQTGGDEARCRSGFGAVFDDAEDASGREWGVILEEVMAGGKAAEAGLLVGDVIVSLNGTGLEVGRREREDPDERFLSLLGELGCGDSVTMEYVRAGERGQISFRMPAEPE